MYGLKRKECKDLLKNVIKLINIRYAIQFFQNGETKKTRNVIKYSN